MRYLLLAALILYTTGVIVGQCADPTACNFSVTPSDEPALTGPCLSLEEHVVHTSGTLAGKTTYRLYVYLPESDEFLSAISTILTGCMDATACNYAPSATYDSGSCDYTSCSDANLAPSTAATPTEIRITSTTTFHQDPLGHPTATGIMGSLLGFFPDLIYDSWVTIGHAPEDGTPQATVSTIASPNQNWVANFEAGNDLVMDDLIGGLWYIYNDGNDQGIPDADGKVLIAQLTTDGDIGVEVSGQYFPDFGTGANGEADGTNAQLFVSELGPPCPSDPNAGCTYPTEGLDCDGNCLNDADSDQICDENDPCIGTYDACGVCNGPGEIYACGCSDIPSGDCDCDGNVNDAIGQCGGTCTSDADADGICDDIDDCVGQYDVCNICNGPGAIYDCGCSDIPTGDCDCNGNQTDAIGICGGSCTTDADSDGICDDVDPCIGALDALGVCNGPCIADADADDICDDDDPCVGAYDAIGVCNGSCPSDIDQDGICDNAEIPGCMDPLACNYDEEATDDDGSCSTFDALGTCGGNCPADTDSDGICDNEDPCVGSLDACGVCNGPGDVYECGCSEIPSGDCDCDGNQLDVVGECGGTCNEDADSDGVCDDIDACIGTLDTCGVCNGPGDVFQCGCNNIPANDCDCDGNQLDALGICGGTCTADVNANGICDDIESLFETEGCTDDEACNFSECATVDNGSCLFDDALGVCGGICAADTDGDGVCDTDEVEGCTHPFACNYNTAATDDDGSCLNEDAVGECGGSCTADADGDGVCDDIDPCVGTLDACGVCNGPGEIYACGCSGIPTGDCDCDGNQTDALGVCGGACAADTNQNGICDSLEVYGCTYPDAANFNPSANWDDGSCLYLSECPEGNCLFDFNSDGGVGATDLLTFLGHFGETCDP